MEAIRVLIFPMPRLLHDILRHLVSEIPGVETIDCADPAGGIAEAAVRSRADVVIAEQADAGPEQACALFERMPRSRALAVSHDGQGGVIYELRPQRRAIGELSPNTVRAAVQATTACAELLRAESTTQPAP